MKEFFGRISSRKFLLTIAGMVLTVLYPELSTPIATLVGIFVTAEGTGDAIERYGSQKTAQTAIEQRTEQLQLTGGADDLNVDKGSFTTGDPSADFQM